MAAPLTNVMTPHLAIFDLDGTLLDTAEDLARAVNLTRAEFSLPPLATAQVIRHVGNGVEKLVARSFADTGVDLADALRRYCGHYERCMTEQTRPYPGVVEGLRRLRAAGWKLAVVSNKHGPAVRAILEQFEMAGLFDRLVGGGDTGRLKPDPEPVYQVMAEMGAVAADTWVIGDHWTDLDAARAAGVHSIFVRYGIGRLEGRTPEHTCASFAEVVNLLLARR